MSKDDEAAEQAKREQILREERERNDRLAREEIERINRARRKDKR